MPAGSNIGRIPTQGAAPAASQPRASAPRLKYRLAVLLTTDRQSYASGKAEMITDMLREARRPPR